MPEGFDFAAWTRLAQTDPVAFEAARRTAVEQAIAIGNDPDRLRRMQWRVDAERRRARTPMKACLRISAMMWEMFFEFRDALDRAVGASGTSAAGCAGQPGRVLRIERGSRRDAAPRFGIDIRRPGASPEVNSVPARRLALVAPPDC